MIQIIKYQNRKLYSKPASKYITMETILTMMTNGVPFTVTSSKTKADITDDIMFAAVVTVAQNKTHKAARSKMIDAFMSAV